MNEMRLNIEEYAIPDDSFGNGSFGNGMSCVDAYFGLLLVDRAEVNIDIFEYRAGKYEYKGQRTINGSNPEEWCALRQLLHGRSILILPFLDTAFDSVYHGSVHRVSSLESVGVETSFLSAEIHLEFSGVLSSQTAGLLVCHDGEPVYVLSVV